MTTDDKVSYGMAAVGAVVIATCLTYWPTSVDPTEDLARCAALFQVEFRDITKDHITKDNPTVRYYEVRGRGSNNTKVFGYVSHFNKLWNYTAARVGWVEYTSSYGRWEHSHHSRTLDECLTYMRVQ